MNYFSVVIPTYNASKTIKRVLDSIVEQSYLPIEVVIVDDYSSDNTIEIIENFINAYLGSIKFIVVEHTRNFGVSKTRNDGIANSTGNFIAFLDDDDTWEKDKLLTIDKILAENPQIKFISHTYAYPDKKESYSSELKIISFSSLLFRNYFATPCVIMSSDIGECFDENMRYSEDFDLWLRIASKTTMYRLDKPLATLGRPLLSPGGLSGNRFSMRKGQIRTYLKIIRYKKWTIFLVPFLIVIALIKYSIRHFFR